MQDFDALRHRVEETTRKLTSVQAERQDQTQSLVDILRQLEEKHAAQEQQLVYYRDRVGPLEQANQQLTVLMENLLDLIDGGFGEDSLAPLRNASEMASTMLASDLVVAGREAAAAATDWIEPEPAPRHLALEDFGENAGHDGHVEEDFSTTSLLDGIRTDDFEDGDAGAFDDDSFADLEMEEDALVSLDAFIEPASGDGADEPSSFESMIENPAPAASDASFEDVSETVLELEAREDVAAGTDSLPEVVKTAAAAAGEPENVARAQHPRPEDPAMAAFDSAMGEPVAEADAGAPDAAPETEVAELAAIAQALEEETSSTEAPVPAPSDIRALLLRVEALAKKAEAMRMARREPETSGEDKADADGAQRDKPNQAGAAA